MGTITVDDGTALHYRDAGSGPALLFHPGFANNLDLWNWLVAELAPTHRCITFDPRGHGASDKPDSDYALDELGRDLVAIAERLDLHDVTVVGHSLGGAVATQAVLGHNQERRISRLALVGPAVPALIVGSEGAPGMPADAYAGLSAALAADYVGLLLGIVDNFYHQTPAATGTWLAGKCLDLPVHLGLRYFAHAADIDYRERLHEVDVPVLVMWGAHDRIADPRWADWLREQNLSGWQVETLNDSGHGAMVDEPGRMADLLRAFVREPEPAGRRGQAPTTSEGRR
ncbi:alpha/beta hydrolase [Rhodococcus sp. T2V]|uniref:alpha/beta fold hydrolase n=1 Tax=Rhodococcus sp. T2V TaxID=3034164 RepID=UPI0023E1D6CC|nr:alpha/beta hydrolase [Rhodococcus sp. T2V]MDF3311850.1 alpha/beta hydrolase [Rhodococcus sp. T2V]